MFWWVMDSFLFWLILILAIIIWLIAAFEFWKIARMKGHEEIRYFWYPFLFTWIGWLIVIALPDRAGNNTASGQSDSNGQTTANSGFQNDELPDL